MYLVIGEETYTCKRRRVSADKQTITYSGVEPDPGTVSGTVEMFRDDGYRMSRDDAGEFARQTYSGTTLTLTNAPEPEPPEPGPEPSGDYVTYGELAEAIREGVNSVE